MNLPTPPGVRQLLRQATHDSHHRLNRHPLLVQLMQPGLDWKKYVLILEAYYHFYLGLEARMAEAERHIPGAFPYGARRKSVWLAEDLAYFSVVPSPSPPETQGWGVGAIPGLGAMAGALYVVEGSSLGGLVISRRLAQLHGLTAQTGARFFNGYGANTDAYWQEFLAWLETRALGPDDLKQSLDMAGYLFARLELLLNTVLREDLSHGPG